MKSVDLPEPKEREYCNCPARHIKGRCDSDFPPNTHSLPLTPTQLKMQYEARKKLGSLRSWEKDPSLTVTSSELGVTVTDNNVCPECGDTFNPKRADAVYCSAKCRVRNSRRS